MALILNSLQKKQEVVVCGQYFEFGPMQIKLIHNEGLAALMTSNKAYLGFVSVPDICVEDKAAPEAIEAMQHATQQGRQNVIRHLQSIIYNLEVSLRRDLDQADIKADPYSFASQGELQAFRDLAALQANAQDFDQAKIDEIKKLKEQIDGRTDSTKPSTSPAGDQTSVKSA